MLPQIRLLGVHVFVLCVCVSVMFCKEIANKNLLLAQGTQCSVVKEIRKRVYAHK